jgi:hypothetical protein
MISSVPIGRQTVSTCGCAGILCGSSVARTFAVSVRYPAGARGPGLDWTFRKPDQGAAFLSPVGFSVLLPMAGATGGRLTLERRACRAFSLASRWRSSKAALRELEE